MQNNIETCCTTESSTGIIKSAEAGLERIEPALSGNARTVLEARYLKKGGDGKPAETPEDMFGRVAETIADAENRFDSGELKENAAVLFYNMMAAGEFLPNSPTLMNAGRDLGQLSACFVIPVGDSMDSIFQAVKDAAMIHKSGGGTGFSFSRLRPKNDVVRSTHGISSGPVSFMAVFDAATETIKQGGTRRGANMGILRVDHPDIREFIVSKQQDGKFANFNISVAVTDAFMAAVRNKGSYDIINPRTGEVSGTENAVEIFELIVESAHRTGDPGIIFIDHINDANPISHVGEVESTNPCGEQPLLPYESCNLGSINLVRMTMPGNDGAVMDWDRLGRTTRLAVRFLDNVIEVNKYPLEIIAETTLKSRKIGLGVMGFADLLIALGISYDSKEAETLADEIIAFVDRVSKEESRHLASERGAFPVFEGSVYDRNGEAPLRNATTTTIAPTGTISIIAGCSSGIEPLFALAYKRNVLDGKELAEFHPALLREAEKRGILDDDFRSEVTKSGTVNQIASVPKDMKDVFRTAGEIPVEWHIRIQAAFQRHTDNAVSKTINFPREATVPDVQSAYIMAHEAGLKGITIYRDGSREQQVLTTGKTIEEELPPLNRESLEPRPRPNVTHGTTEKIVTGCGNLYVTINRDENGLCEVFCQMGRSGGCTSSQSEAISRLISIALRSGVKLEDVVAQLKGIRCPSAIWSNGRLILSCSDAIATALSRYLDTQNGEGNGIPVLHPDADSDDLSKKIIAGKKLAGEMAGVCPDCGGLLVYGEGCMTCRACGFSKCG